MPRTGAFREQWAAPPRTSVKDRDGVPQKGPCVSELWQDGRGREAEGPLVAKTA